MVHRAHVLNSVPVCERAKRESIDCERECACSCTRVHYNFMQWCKFKVGYEAKQNTIAFPPSSLACLLNCCHVSFVVGFLSLFLLVVESSCSLISKRRTFSNCQMTKQQQEKTAWLASKLVSFVVVVVIVCSLVINYVSYVLLDLVLSIYSF